jgi:hypothetical protein
MAYYYVSEEPLDLSFINEKMFANKYIYLISTWKGLVLIRNCSLFAVHTLMSNLSCRRTVLLHEYAEDKVWLFHSYPRLWVKVSYQLDAPATLFC